jgi:DNA (cytosine-5)-methyltransferase 1
MTRPTVNDFFCGAGGMGLGFKQAGFEIVGSWDYDKYAVDSYKHNVEDHVIQADIRDMSWEDIPAADVWTFGFPCQDLSNAGKQAGMIMICHEEDCGEEFDKLIDSRCPKCQSRNFKSKTRSGLFFEVMRLIDETAENAPERLPKFLLAENVKGLRKYIPVLKEEYEVRGYEAEVTLCNSKYWGVPQNRERYFVAGVRKEIGKFSFPEEQRENIPKLFSVLETDVDERYYMNPNKAAEIIQKAVDVLRIREATSKGYAEATVGDSINISHPKSQTRRGRVGKQVAQTLLTGQEQVVVTDIQGVFTTPDGLAYCCDANYFKGTSPGDIGNARRTQVIEGEEPNFRVRRFTPREFGRLQGFPDNYEIIVSDAQFYKQMGNAVTVNVAAAIAAKIKDFLSGQDVSFSEIEMLREENIRLKNQLNKIKAVIGL